MMTAELEEITQVVPIDAIAPNPSNPRKTIDPSWIETLALSIAEVGVLQAPLVRPAPDGAAYQFEIVVGESRWRAAKLAGCREIKCTVRHVSDQAALEIAIIENRQRKSVPSLEEAEAIERLMAMGGYSAAALARRLSVKPEWLSARLRLLVLIPDVKAAYRAGAISLEHAGEIAKLPEHRQASALRACFSALLLDGQVDAFIRRGQWRELTAAGLSASELRHWIAHHSTWDITDKATQDAIPELADALEDATADRSRVFQVSSAEDLAPAEARILRVIRRERWIEIDVDGTRKPSQWLTHERCESMQTVVVTHPNDKDRRVTMGCLKPGCDVHRPAAVPDPAELERRKRERDWRAKRPEFLRALSARVQSVDLTPALVKACLPEAAVSRLKCLFGLSVNGKSAAAALVLASIPAEASRDDSRLLAITKAIGMTPDQWEKRR